MFEAPKELEQGEGEADAQRPSGPMSLSERWRYLGSTKFDKPQRQGKTLADLLEVEKIEA